MRPIVPVLCLVALPLARCATTSFDSKWSAPDAEPVKMHGQKVAAVVMTKSPTARRPAEDALARETGKREGVGIPACTIVPNDLIKDLDSSKRLPARAGAYDGSFSNYRGYGWGTVHDPGRLQTGTIISVETLIDSFRQEKLLWAGMSETINPSRADALVTELAGRIAGEMEKEGLLVKP